MATGSLDANGIWQYGGDDPLSPFPDFMGLLTEPLSDEIGLLKQATDEVPVAITYATGWRAPTATAFPIATPPTVTRVGNRVRILLGNVENSATTSFVAAGQVDGFVIPVGSRPLTTVVIPATINVAQTSLGGGQILVRPTGVVTLQTVAAIGSAPAGSIQFAFGSVEWEV